MKRHTWTTLVCVAAAALSATNLSAKPLPSDERILTGKLQNGVTWMYRRHDNPPGKMALMMHVDTGSLNETDAQRGLAHFTEHMAFNGSENFPPGELIPYFESIGMQFGADLNAFTSFDQTAYMLFTPDTETSQIDKALTVLSDYAFRCLLLEEEIDKERGVVLEEIRLGKNARQRIRDKLWPELFENTRFAERIVLGKEEVIESAPRKEFLDYYRSWYRPERITVMLVGDADPDPIVPLLEKWFGQHKPDESARPEKGPEFKTFTRQRAFVMTDPELSTCEVQMLKVRPGRAPTTTSEQWRTELVEEIGSWIIGRRFEQRVQKGQASYRRASAYVFDFFQDGLLVTGSAVGEPDDWTKMLEELVMEVSGAREHGFTRHELELAKKEITADAERAVRTEPTRNAKGFLFTMLSAVNNEEPILSAQQQLDLTRELMPTIQVSEVSAAFAAHFAPGTFAYVIEMPDKQGVAVPTREDVLAAARAALARKTEAPEDEDQPTDLLASMPAPGKVVESTTDPDLKITSAWLSNGIRVHHRFMDYKKDSVWVSISVAGGEIEETAKNAGITEVATLAFDQAATHRLASPVITDIMTGKNISVGAGVDSDAFLVTINGSVKDLEVGLQLAHALITDGKIEESAFKNWKQRSLQQYEMQSKMPFQQAIWALMELVGGDDPRITVMTPDKIESQTLSAAQDWLQRLCRDASIEVAVVGEISLDKAMPLIEKYVGSLPTRPRAASRLDGLRKLPRKSGPYARHVEVETMNPQGMALFGFMSCDENEVFNKRALHVASQVLSSRLIKKIREELSLVYTTGAAHRPGEAYRDSGVFMSWGPCSPDNVNRVVQETEAIFKAFAEEGPTEEELENAKKQVYHHLDTRLKEPDYWWRVLRHLDLRGLNLDDQKNVKEYYGKFTAEQVRDVFKKYHTSGRSIRVTAVPAPSKKQEETPTPEPAAAPS